MRGIVTLPMLSVIDSNVIKIENSKGVIHNGMSLFQDLKLKRRKVDSRCSSDGESIGTSESTSSLSPDAQTTSEGSPKQDKDRCLTPEDLVAPVSSKEAFPPQLFFMIKSETATRNNNNKVPYNHFHHHNNNNNIHTSINGRSSPAKQNGMVNGVIKLSNGSTNGIIHENGDIVVVKSEPMDHLLENGHSNGLSNGKMLNGHNKDVRVRDRSSSPEEKSSSPPTTTTTPTTTMLHHHENNNNNRSNTNSPPTTNGHSSDTESVASQSSAISRASISSGSIKREKDSPSPRYTNNNNNNSGNTTIMENGNKDNSNTKDSSNTGHHNHHHHPHQRRKSPPLPRSTSSSPPSNGASPTTTSRLESTLTITKHNNNNNSSNNNNNNNSKEGLVNGNSRIPSPQSSSSPPQQQQQHSENHNYHNGINHLPPHLQPTQNHLHARLTQGLSDNNNNNNNGNRSTINVSSPLVHSEIRNLTEKPDPLSVVTSTSLSFHHHSMYRINGVRPEVISGGAVTPTTTTTNSANASPNSSSSCNNNSSSSNTNSPTGGLLPVQSSNQNNNRNKSPTLSSRSPNSSPSNSNSSGSLIHSPGNATIVAGGSLGMMVNSSTGGGGANHHVNLNRTPTVIMGEAGGVRTMLWSQPGQTIPNSPVDLNSLTSSLSPPNSNGHITTTTSSLSSLSSSSNHGYPSNTQDGHTVPSPINSNNNNNNSTTNNNNNNNTKVGISMERLWESQALNLSTSPNSNNNNNNNNSSTSNKNKNNNNSNNGHLNHNNNNINSTNNNTNNNNMNYYYNHPPPPLGMTNGHTTNGHTNTNTNGHSQTNPDDDDYEQPMICMICEDRATGLHYGIITCEGCKGFFKRTVQNRRVYTCVADGTCEITKAQRNRCQYCRFKKCIEQGMVLQAVREDRMPGGRNSGAVYNLYKVPVKYRKHKKGNRVAAGKGEKAQQQQQQNQQQNHHPQQQQQQQQQTIPPPVQSGNILKTALTSPNDVTLTHLRQSMPFETAHTMITQLVQCDNFHDIAALQNWEELLEARGDLSEKLCQMGDSIVYRLVQWTKRLPFYPEVPVDVHTRVLTHKWHELLVLTTSAWQAMHTPGPPLNVSPEEETMESLQVLQRCLQAMMGRSLTLEQLRQDVGQMVERLTYLTRAFRRMNIRIEEYVCLKVIAMLQNTGTRSPEVGVIQERYIKCLRTFLEVSCPGHPNRLSDLLRTLPEVQAAAALLLESKMFYVPFLLNSALLQR